ncbi:MAG: helix-turn-helix domain-containing protein [Roseivivax sp.]|nr:helix-turn-helix domain-containing protein [Roseivivax sp.]
MTEAELPVQVMPLAQFIAGHPWRVGLMHDRNQDVLIWITRGQGKIVVNGVRRGLGAHNALLLPKGTLFALDLGPQSLAQVLVASPGTSASLPRTPRHVRVRDVMAQAELTGALDAIHRERTQNRPMVATALAAHLELIAVWLHRMAAAGYSDAPDQNAAHRLMGRFAALVVERYATGEVMADYAHALDVTPTHLTRVSRSACGISAADILTQRRLYAARLMLGRPRPSIKDVAQALGFSSAAYFTRFVQQHTGLSPTALRAGGTVRIGMR